MKWFILIVVLWCLIFSVNAEDEKCPDKHVVCYYGSWAVYREDAGYFNVTDIDYSLCTHLVYSFAGLDIESKIVSLDSNLDIIQGNYAAVINLREHNPCLKVLLAIGGWNEGSRKYSVMASTEASRVAFAENVLRFLIHWGFDGLDFDWEYPTQRGGIPDDLNNFSELLKLLHERLSKWDLLLTMAIPMALDNFDAAYDVAALDRYLDYVSIMAYDYTPTNSKTTGLLAPYSKIEESIQNLISKGLRSNKMILGLPTYARTFKLADASKNGLGQPTNGPGAQGKFTRENGFLSYYELQLKLDTGRYKEQCPDGNCFASYKLDWLSYDTIDTYKQKTQLAIDKQLGGVMVWTMDTDDITGQFGEPYTVLNAIHEQLRKDNL